MRKTKLAQRASILSLALAALLSAPVAMTAQPNGGLFQRGVADEEFYGMGYYESGLLNNGNRTVNPNGTFNNENFGETPLTGGLLILAAAGAGYALLRRKEGEK